MLILKVVLKTVNKDTPSFSPSREGDYRGVFFIFQEKFNRQFIHDPILI